MNEIPIFAKTYDMLLWLVPATLKYPREHRFALALRTQQAAFEFNELIVLARKTRDKRDLLLRADAHLEQLRLYLRLAHDLKLLISVMLSGSTCSIARCSHRLIRIARSSWQLMRP